VALVGLDLHVSSSCCSCRMYVLYSTKHEGSPSWQDSGTGFFLLFGGSFVQANANANAKQDKTKKSKAKWLYSFYTPSFLLFTLTAATNMSLSTLLTDAVSSWYTTRESSSSSSSSYAASSWSFFSSVQSS
jgi:hypothetical protein